MGQYCVYNTSLQNITLQIPIVTKSSILDVAKVTQIRLCFVYTLNKKSKTPLNENKARAKLQRQHSKRVAKHSKFYLLNYSIIICVKMIPEALKNLKFFGPDQEPSRASTKNFFCENSSF